MMQYVVTEKVYIDVLQEEELIACFSFEGTSNFFLGALHNLVRNQLLYMREWCMHTCACLQAYLHMCAYTHTNVS